MGCTLAISGEPDELVTAAAKHSVAVHGHADTPELREQLRGLLGDEPTVSRPGAFVQLIEFDTVHHGRGPGPPRATRCDGEFPSYTEAMANSGHPATAAFLKELRSISSSEPQFRNLDVRSARTY